MHIPDDQRGIIPADAGSTSQWDNPGVVTGDHPRGCGEHISKIRVILQNEGSSPRMRGALTAEFKPQRLTGIIPADAGSTHVRHPQAPSQQDHPRGCGEHPYLRFGLVSL